MILGRLIYAQKKTILKETCIEEGGRLKPEIHHFFMLCKH